MVKHDNSAGPWARNSNGQLVAAWDKQRTPQGATHNYFCHCHCKQSVTLKRGEKKCPHFAYTSKRKNGCTGAAGCLESKLHYTAKWLIHDNFSKINFWRVCYLGHRITKKQYTGPEWKATVEKKIPGTKRIADVLLTNCVTNEVVALEVFNSHAVGDDKKEECDLAGVSLIEVDAQDVTPDCLDLDNELDEYEPKDCGKCVRIAAEEVDRKKKKIAENVKRQEKEEAEKVKRQEKEEAERVIRMDKEAVENIEKRKQEIERAKKRARWSHFYRDQRVRAEAVERCNELANRQRAQLVERESEQTRQ